MKYSHQMLTSESTHSEDIRHGSRRHQESEYLNKDKQSALNVQRQMLLQKCINKRKRLIAEETVSQHPHPSPKDTHRYESAKNAQITRQEDVKKPKQTGLAASAPAGRKAESAEQDKALVDKFLEDNADRRAKKRSVSPVPVQPILVPSHLRGCLASGGYVSPATNKTSSPRAKDKENTLKARPIVDRSRIGRNIDERAIHAALEYEEGVERRAREARLRGNNDNAVMDLTDPLLVAEYEDEIFAHLRETEMETLPNPCYTSDDPNETEITWTMRDVLIDWVVEIHFLFQLLPETLFLAVNVIDRFLSKQRVSVERLQLIGVTALLIATKFEEVSSPQLKAFLLMTGDSSLTEEDLITAEELVLKVLEYKICYSNPLNFLRRASKTGPYDPHCRMLSKYLMEISCVDHRFVGIPPSKVAAASLWLAQKMLESGTWVREKCAFSYMHTPLFSLN
ncbi:cyclin-like protein [Dichotomocladium elegans]|nr:cyclin-like protein [Dichotomocladium elegans]